MELTSTSVLPVRHGNHQDRKTKPGALLDVWSLFQKLSCILIGLGVFGVLVYLSIKILPRMGHDLTGSIVVSGWSTFNTSILYTHILTAIPPLILGLFAFSATLRRYSGRSHRWIGTTYCIGIWISAVTGLLLATGNEHGTWAKLGFSTLAVVWFVTTYMAYVEARRKAFPSHRNWMIRSYAITLAVVSVRPMFMIEPPYGLDYDSWYQIVTWLCWVPNLIIAELYLRATLYSGKLKKRRPTVAAAATTVA